MRFKVNDPVIFESKNRLVPWGSLGVVIDIKSQPDGTWVTAKFEDKAYTMKEDDKLFALDFDAVYKERDALRAALEFYANEDNYRHQSKSGHVEDWAIPIMEDEGDIAQKALGKQ